MKKFLPIVIVIGAIFLVLIFLTYWEPPPRDVLDDTIWRVIDLNDEPLIDETTLTIRFHDRKVSGSSGCNRFNGRYKVAGDTLTITIREATTDNCLNPGVMKQENSFKGFLMVAISFSLEGQELTIVTVDGSEVIFISMLGDG